MLLAAFTLFIYILYASSPLVCGTCAHCQSVSNVSICCFWMYGKICLHPFIVVSLLLFLDLLLFMAISCNGFLDGVRPLFAQGFWQRLLRLRHLSNGDLRKSGT